MLGHMRITGSVSVTHYLELEIQECLGEHFGAVNPLMEYVWFIQCRVRNTRCIEKSAHSRINALSARALKILVAKKVMLNSNCEVFTYQNVNSFEIGHSATWHPKPSRYTASVGAGALATQIESTTFLI